MTLVVVNQGEEQMLDLILAVNYTLHLYVNDPTSGLTAEQVDALTEADFTEATFTGYAAVALTGGGWVTTQDDPTTGTYAQQTFTCTLDGAAETVYGYYITRTSDGALVWFEPAPGPLTVELAGDAVAVTPTITLDDDQEATVTARGIIAKDTHTAHSVFYSATGVTDFALAGVEVDSSRLYRVHLDSQVNMTSGSAANWSVFLRADAVSVLQIARLNNHVATGQVDQHSWSKLWEPDSGTYNLDLRLVENGGSASIEFNGSALLPREFWVEDIGPRP